MINIGAILKGVFVTFGSFALSYNLLQTPYAPPLQGTQGLSEEYAALADQEGLMDQDRIAALERLAPPGAGSVQWEDEYESAFFTSNQILNPRELALFHKMNARRGEPLMTPEEFLQAIYTPSAITPLEQVPEHVKIPAAVRNQELVHIYRDKLETLFPGDEMYLHSDHLGGSLVMVVDQVVDHLDGTLTWHGHLKGADQQYRVSFTQGTLFTLANLSTPFGQYQLEAQGEYGWLVPARSSRYGLEISGFAARAWTAFH